MLLFIRKTYEEVTTCLLLGSFSHFITTNSPPCFFYTDGQTFYLFYLFFYLSSKKVLPFENEIWLVVMFFLLYIYVIVGIRDILKIESEKTEIDQPRIFCLSAHFLHVEFLYLFNISNIFLVILLSPSPAIF